MSIWRIFILVPLLLISVSCARLCHSSRQCGFREVEVQYWHKQVLEAVRSDTEWARCGGKRLVAGPLILYEDEIEYIFDPRKRKRVQAVIQAYSQKVQQSFLVRVDLDQVTGVVLSMSEEPAGVWAGADK